MQTILVPTQLGPRSVQASITGPFAIHLTVSRPYYYTVTHLFTGLAVTTEQDSRDDAEQVVRALLNTNIDWYAVSPLTWAKTRTAARRAVAAVVGLREDGARAWAKRHFARKAQS